MPALGTKHDLIAETIRRRIKANELRSGEAIPSYRELVAEHGVAVSTVRQAVGVLEAEGLITPIRGRGCVVAETRATWEVIGLAVLGSYNFQLMADTLEAIDGELMGRQCDLVVRVFRRLEAEHVESLIKLGRRLDGLLLQGSVPVRAIEQLSRAGVRFVVIGNPVDGPCPPGVSQVTADVQTIVQLAFGHLAGLGHRRIAMVRSQGSAYCEELSRVFNDCARENGLEGETGELVWSTRGVEASQSFVNALVRLPRRPTALLVDSAARAARIMDDLQAAGVAVPGELSLLAISEGPALGGGHQSLTRVEVAVRGMVLRAAEIVQTTARPAPRVAHVEKLLPRFVAGQTCQAASDQPPAGPR